MLRMTRSVGRGAPLRQLETHFRFVTTNAPVFPRAVALTTYDT